MRSFEVNCADNDAARMLSVLVTQFSTAADFSIKVKSVDPEEPLFRTSTITAIVFDALKSARQPMSIDDLHKVLVRRGYKSWPYATMRKLVDMNMAHKIGNRWVAGSNKGSIPSHHIQRK
jgi:hypothetical protein